MKLKIGHLAHTLCHLGYFGAVFIETSYWYGKFAAVLFAITLIDAFRGGE